MFEDLKDKAAITAKEAAELKRLYEDKAKEAESVAAELEASKLRKRKESNRNQMVRDLEDLLQQEVKNNSTLHQKNIEALERLQKSVSDTKIEEFKLIKLSELKQNQDHEVAELQAKHKQQRDALLAFLEVQLERGQSDLPNPLDEQLGQRFAEFLSGLNSEKQQELNKVEAKFSADLEAAEKKIKQMIQEVAREPLIDDK